MDSLEDQRCIFEIELEKDKSGLGLTVAGYICEKGGNPWIVWRKYFSSSLSFFICCFSESLCGIFVKKVVDGSVADIQGRIRPNDQVIEVDGVPLSGYCNQVWQILASDWSKPGHVTRQKKTLGAQCNI